MNRRLTIIFLLAICTIFACDYSDYHEYTVKYIVSGDCPAVTVVHGNIDIVYSGLAAGKSYTCSEYPDRPKTCTLDVYKLSGDATTVTATIYVDGVQVATQTTTAAYGHIRVEYTLQN